MARDAKSGVGGRPYMLQDVMTGRCTEINYLNGYVSEQGRQVGVKTPPNDKIVELVNASSVGLLKPDPKNLGAPLANGRPLTGERCLLLPGVSGAEDGGLAHGAGDQLKPDGKAGCREAAGH